MKKVCFAGCSYTAGNGWIDDIPENSFKIPGKDSPHLWVNLCHQNIQKLNDLDLVNIGQGGASNTEIFQNVIRFIGREGSNIDLIFCQWTSMPRYNFNVGFELWDTAENFFNLRTQSHDVNLNRGDSWPREYIDDLINRLKVLHHLHWEIVKIVDYSNTILNLSKILNFKVFFINGLCPWDDGYFLELIDVKPESYTPFTKKDILNIESRDDEDIYKLYSMAHRHYRDAGGINQEDWINLYSSFQKIKIDVNFDQLHPGTESNKLYYQIVNQRLKELNFI